MFWTILIVGALVILINLLFVSDPKPIRGIYQQPGKFYYLKYWAFYVLLALRKKQNERKAHVDGQNAGYGMRSRSTVEEMDKAQTLPKEHPKAVDAVYFNASNQGGYFLVAATARRHNNVVQTILYIRVPGLGLLEMPNLPDTTLITTKELSFSADGLEIKPVTPMKQWKITFDGKMRLIKASDNEAEMVSVHFDLDWHATTRMFDFDTDMHPYALCSAMAREKWNSALFDNLKVAHQTHYEQFGETTGTIHVDPYGKYEFQGRGVRDHSYGNIRDWYDLYRYGIQYLHLEDGTSICVGLICMPRTLTRLPIGYVMKPDGRMELLTDLEWELHECGEDGDPPKDFKITFTAGNKKYKVLGHVIDAPIFYMGENWDARIHERMCTFTVNGVPGCGISEWEYRNTTHPKPAFYKSGKIEKF